MATLRGLGSRVIGRQRIDSTAWGGSFPALVIEHATRPGDSPARPPSPMTKPVRARNRPEINHGRAHTVTRLPGAAHPRATCENVSENVRFWSEVPGTGLEPVRPRGAARFKLAVSAFHHPGRPWAPRSASEPIGRLPPNSRPADRCCLILLTSEGASAHGTRHPHLPVAFRTARPGVCGMTEFHRPNERPTEDTRGDATTLVGHDGPRTGSDGPSNRTRTPSGLGHNGPAARSQRPGARRWSRPTARSPVGPGRHPQV